MSTTTTGITSPLESGFSRGDLEDDACNACETQFEDMMVDLGLHEHPGIDDRVDTIQETDEWQGDTHAKLSTLTLDELSDMEDDDDADVLAAFRERRMAQIAAVAEASKYGDCKDIVNSEFSDEVVNASDNDQSVVLLLYRPKSADCDKLETCVRLVAKKYPGVKFVKLLASSGIKNFPIDHCPTLMCYRDRIKVGQLVKLEAFDGAKTNAATVEWVLSTVGILVSDLEHDPRPGFTMRKGGAVNNKHKYVGRGGEGLLSRADARYAGLSDSDDDAGDDGYRDDVEEEDFNDFEALQNDR